jgi:hypothetical protein
MHRTGPRLRPGLGEVRIPMKNGLLIAAGALIAVAGIVFCLQGLGYIDDSSMTGVTFWAAAGPVIAIAGIVIMVFGLRRRRSA